MSLFVSKERKKQIIFAFSSFAGLIVIGTVVFHSMEPWTWSEALYFTVVTLTTVGYGDLTPSTGESQIFAVIFILIGVSVALAALGIIGTNYIERHERLILKRARRREQLHKENQTSEK